ncbi:unnamed protein product [Meganyctiphanes norvegica]|uniref:Reverse transcriptase domain-containing protein n=1 Tax=Meganyctiphanes norvegica TaxID=48144 RepID=A0AAV2R8U6_MEGNR
MSLVAKRPSGPPIGLLCPPEFSAANPSQIPNIMSFIPDLLSRGVLRKITSPQPLFYSRLFLVRNKDGPFRMVIDLSRLNKCCLEVPTFRMETVSSIISGIIQELWGCSIDLQDAFFNGPVSWVFHKNLAFILDRVLYVFQYLPFGLAISPWAFSRVVRPIKGQCHLLGIRLHSYLDDFIVLQLSRQALRRDISTILDLFQSLGIAVNEKKSHLTPSQTGIFGCNISLSHSHTVSHYFQGPVNQLTMQQLHAFIPPVSSGIGTPYMGSQFRIVSRHIR